MGKPDIFRSGKPTETETSYTLRIQQLAISFLGDENSVFREDSEDATTNYIIKNLGQSKKPFIRIYRSRTVGNIATDDEIAFSLNAVIFSSVPKRALPEEFGLNHDAPREWHEMQNEEAEKLFEDLQRSITHR